MTATTHPAIAAFITAQLDADEAAARAAQEWTYEQRADWRLRGEWDVDGVVMTMVGAGEKGTVGYAHADETAAHIARHDPARVLAQVAAIRRILELHESWPVLVQSEPKFETGGDIDSMTMRMSQQMNWLTEKEYRERFGDEPPTTPILRALASIWKDADGWQEEWR